MWRKLREFLGLEDYLFGASRDPAWSTLRNRFIRENPKCAVCGKKGSQIHHIFPVHLFKDLELVKENLVTLCSDCHFSWGHFYSYRSFNKDIRKDIERIKQRP